MKNISCYFKSIFLLLLFSNNINAQLTYVPDDGFEQRLISLGLDSGPLDDYVQTSAIDTVTMLTLLATNQSLSLMNNIIGIQDFTSLNYLKIENTSFNFGLNTTLDLSLLNNLDSLFFYDNYQTSGNTFDLILPQNLKHIYLEGVYVAPYLDLTTSPNLESLILYECTSLQDIDFSNSQNLQTIYMTEGVIQYIDVSFCNNLQQIELLSNGTGFNNSLHYLNLKNGNNHNMTFISDYISFSNLSDICVDSVNSSFSQNILNNMSVMGFYPNLTDICATNKITGEVKYDINNDGCVTSNTYLTNYIINSTDGVNSFSSNQMNNGSYSIYTFPGNYQTSILNLPFYLTSNPLSKTTNFIGEHNVDTANFCISANQSINDVSVFITPLNTTSPGFNTFLSLVIKNTGTTTLSGDVTLTYDNNLLTYVSSSDIVSNQTPNALTFNYNNLLPFETRFIYITFNIATPPTTNIGDTLSFNAIITPIINDYNDTNNTFNIDQVVIGSFDPNDINVLEGDEVSIIYKDEYLHYFVRFQNTGNAPAININVQNELDNKLDWNSLQIIGSSHLLNLSMYNNRADFKFNNINLPDSTSNEPASHGYIYYKIKPINNIVVGDSIYATANIYFDFNPAVVTNTVFTTFIEEPLLVNNLNLVTDISVYPVPTTDVLNIMSAQKVSKIEIYNQMGELVLIKNNQNSIDISILSAGLYFCKITNLNGQVITKKIIKR